MKFNKWLEKEGLTPASFCRKYKGWKIEAVWRLATGSRCGNPKTQLDILKLTRGEVQPNDWIEWPRGTPKKWPIEAPRKA